MPATGAFCANCLREGPRLRPRQLEDGGPVFIFCARCDEEEPEPAPPPPSEAIGMRWGGKRYVPLEEVLAKMPVRILMAIRRFGWISSPDLGDVIGIPPNAADTQTRNLYSVTMSRLRRDGYLRAEVRRARWRGRMLEWNEYQITERGEARLACELSSPMAGYTAWRADRSRAGGVPGRDVKDGAGRCLGAEIGELGGASGRP